MENAPASRAPHEMVKLPGALYPVFRDTYRAGFIWDVLSPSTFRIHQLSLGRTAGQCTTIWLDGGPLQVVAAMQQQEWRIYTEWKKLRMDNSLSRNGWAGAECGHHTLDACSALDTMCGVIYHGDDGYLFSAMT